MTFEEIAALAIKHGFGGTFTAQGDQLVDHGFVEAVKEAIDHERKECAKICEDAWMAFTQPSNGRPSLNPFPELKFAAAKIRARGQQ